MPKETKNSPTITNGTASNPISYFEWDKVLRIIGVATGATGIIAALLYLLGYAAVNQRLNALGLSNTNYPILLPTEFYLINGVSPLIVFLINLAGLLFFYFLARVFIYTIGRYLLRLTKPPISLAIGVFIGAILVYFGINSIITFGSNAVLDAFVLTFSGVDIISSAVEVFFSSNNKEERNQAFTEYYNIAISLFTTIKLISLGIAIFLFIFSETNFSKSEFLACQYITENPIEATVYSSTSLGITEEEVSLETYKYTGFYLLYTDYNYYYFFREINPDNLKPKSIIVVKKDSVEAIEFENNTLPNNWNLSIKCSDLYGN